MPATSASARRASGRGTPAPSRRPDPPPVVGEIETKDEPEAKETPPEPKEELPEGVQALDDGTWLYSLQFDPEPTASGKTDLISRPMTVRIPGKIWARNLRQATAQSTSEADVLFWLTSSMVRLPMEVLDRLDARDYSVISGRVNWLLLGNAYGGH